jgi:mRNA deadenylase 3'-5' endonuclease subunit Ccr4
MIVRGPQKKLQIELEEQKRPTQRKRDNDFKLYTWNVRTLYRLGAMTMLINALKVYNPDITALQDIR